MYWFMSVLGLALAMAPFVLGYGASTAAVWTSIILGLAIALSAGYKAVAKDAGKWENWVVVIAGVLTAVAPFVLGFSGISSALWSCIFLGGLAAILAIYQSFFSEKAKPGGAQHSHA